MQEDKKELKFNIYPEFSKYEVCENGQIFNINSHGSGRRIEVKQSVKPNGYLFVFLFVNGKRYSRLVHRMVAISFIPNPDNKPQVNHINGIKTDNRVENLEWNTPKENLNHALLNGLSKRKEGSDHPRSKIDSELVMSIFKEKEKGCSFLSKKYNLDRCIISGIINGWTWNSVTGMNYKRRKVLKNEQNT